MFMGNLYQKFSCQVTGYEVDSRKTRTGNMFFALKGQKDGHDFLKNASESGAAFAVVEESYQGPSYGLFLIRVQNVLFALQLMARDSLLRKKVKIIAITGSLGKTTTKEFTYTFLEKTFKTDKSPRNYNSQIGLPLAVLNRNIDAEVLILEMGMTEKGHIRRLVEIAPPDIALVTNIEMVHVSNFKDALKGIAEAKSEIFSKTKTKIKLVPEELSYSSFPKDAYTFSRKNPKARFFLEDGFQLRDGENTSKKFSLPFEQAMFVQDFLHAASIARCMGVSFDEIIERSQFLKIPERRFEKKEIQGALFINDAYNSSPASCALALKEMPNPEEEGRRIAILGPIVDLGKFSKEEHYKLGKIAADYADLLLCFHEDSQEIKEGFLEKKKQAEIFFDHKSLAQRLKKIMRRGDVILVKGSNSYEMDKIFSFFL